MLNKNKEKNVAPSHRGCNNSQQYKISYDIRHNLPRPSWSPASMPVSKLEQPRGRHATSKASSANLRSPCAFGGGKMCIFNLNIIRAYANPGICAEN